MLGRDADAHAVPNALTAVLDQDALRLARLVAHQHTRQHGSNASFDAIKQQPVFKFSFFFPKCFFRIAKLALSPAVQARAVQIPCIKIYRLSTPLPVRLFPSSQRPPHKQISCALVNTAVHTTHSCWSFYGLIP